MTDDLQDSVVEEALSPEETAYWDSKGATDEVKPEPKPEAKAEEPKPEQPVEQKAEDKEPEVEKLVKHGAFEEERQRRKKAEAATRELEKRLAFLEGQQQALKPGEQPAKQPTLDEIDEQKDPVAAIAALKAEITARKQVEAQQQAVHGIIATGQQYCRKFAEAEPQFFDAYNFLRQAAAERLTQQGVPGHEVEARVNLKEIKLINDALDQGLDPAAAMWHWAQIAGFKPKTESPAAVNNANRNAMGQFAKPQPTEAERIAALEQAQKASKSLGSVPAGGGDGPLTLEAMADMDEEEFAAATAGKKWDRLHRNGVI